MSNKANQDLSSRLLRDEASTFDHSSIRITIFLLVSLLISSCSTKLSKFKITNHTSLPIDSLYIMPNKNIDGKYISLAPGQTKYYYADVMGQTSDGGFTVAFKQGNKKRDQDFGYFSNGNTPESIIPIKIYTDSIRIKELF